MKPEITIREVCAGVILGMGDRPDYIPCRDVDVVAQGRFRVARVSPCDDRHMFCEDEKERRQERPLRDTNVLADGVMANHHVALFHERTDEQAVATCSPVGAEAVENGGDCDPVKRGDGVHGNDSCVGARNRVSGVVHAGVMQYSVEYQGRL